MYNPAIAQQTPQMQLVDIPLQNYHKTALFEKVFNSPEKTLHYIKHPVIEFEIDEPQSKDGLTVDETTFWADYYEDPNFKYEWNNSKLEEIPMSSVYGMICSDWFITLIKAFLKSNNIDYIIFNDFGFKLNLPQKTVIRRPDYSFILGEKAVNCDLEATSYKGIYDICIEILSHSKPQYIEKDTVDKKLEYCQGKIKEYYIIDQAKKHTIFYRLNKKGFYTQIKPKNGIIHSEVLPGFQFRLNDIYKQPNNSVLMNDPVYQSYVEVELQQERKAKEAALALAEQERIAKERLEQLLRDKGIVL